MLAKSNGFLGTNGRPTCPRLHRLHPCWGIVLGELPIWMPRFGMEKTMFLVFILRSSSISSISDALLFIKVPVGHCVGGCGILRYLHHVHGFLFTKSLYLSGLLDSGESDSWKIQIRSPSDFVPANSHWKIIHLQGGAPKITKLVYNSNNYGLWYL